jgi:hypothetical protein
MSVYAQFHKAHIEKKIKNPHILNKTMTKIVRKGNLGRRTLITLR